MRNEEINLCLGTALLWAAGQLWALTRAHGAQPHRPAAAVAL